MKERTPIPVHPRTMSLDLALVQLERMLLESYVERTMDGEGMADIALNGLGQAYELALRDRYPYKLKGSVS